MAELKINDLDWDAERLLMREMREGPQTYTDNIILPAPHIVKYAVETAEALRVDLKSMIFVRHATEGWLTEGVTLFSRDDRANYTFIAAGEAGLEHVILHELTHASLPFWDMHSARFYSRLLENVTRFGDPDFAWSFEAVTPAHYALHFAQAITGRQVTYWDALEEVEPKYPKFRLQPHEKLTVARVQQREDS